MANIQFVDINDEPIGGGTIEEALERGIRHRTSRVFLVNSAGKILLQKRARHMTSSPGLWDQSAAGKVDEGETYENAALREMREEVGVTSVPLTEIGYFYYEETDAPEGKKRFNRVYTGHYDGEVFPNQDEVADVRWVSKEKLDEWVEKRPEEFTASCLRAYKFVRKLL